MNAKDAEDAKLKIAIMKDAVEAMAWARNIFLEMGLKPGAATRIAFGAFNFDLVPGDLADEPPEAPRRTK